MSGTGHKVARSLNKDRPSLFWDVPQRMGVRHLNASPLPRPSSDVSGTGPLHDCPPRGTHSSAGRRAVHPPSDRVGEDSTPRRPQFLNSWVALPISLALAAAPHPTLARTEGRWPPADERQSKLLGRSANATIARLLTGTMMVHRRDGTKQMNAEDIERHVSDAVAAGNVDHPPTLSDT
jgi:hypothetical protein